MKLWLALFSCYEQIFIFILFIIGIIIKKSHLAQTSQNRSGTIPGNLISTVSSSDSMWRQIKNLQTLRLVREPTYCTLCLELLLLLTRSSKKVCLAVTSQGQ